MPDLPITAPLFDAAIDATRHAYGRTAAPKIVHIVTYSGLEVSFQIPPDWQSNPNAPLIRSSPDCFAEVLATLVQAGRRLTRASLMDEMQRLGRKRAESTVSLALEDLMRLRVVDNKQEPSSKGYGLISWD